MTQSEQLAEFVGRVSYSDLSADARAQLKIRILDALGCAIGALDGEPIRIIREEVRAFGGSPVCTLIAGEKTAADRTAFYNSALVRYLDFNDSYLAPGETCHPSDNLGAVLAASEYAGRSGSELMVALALAYQVQCRLSDVAPVRARGFDHTTQGAYALAAGISKALGLDRERTVNAIGICGTAFNALRVTRTGALSHWKGLAYPNTAFCCAHATFLAARGITGPREVFEGNKGFIDTIAGEFSIDWASEDLERVTRTSVKKYNAEFHSQSAIEAALELKRENGLDPAGIAAIEVDIFEVAYNIIGGGEEGEKKTIRTKEEADHSLPYLVAVALLDDQVMPAQYAPDRITRPDVQDLLRKVTVCPSEEYTRRFPQEHACKVTILLKDGRRFVREKRDYEGFYTRPVSWEGIVRKFETLCGGYVDADLRGRIVAAVAHLEDVTVRELADLLARVPGPG